MTTTTRPAAWYADPSGRHLYRYWDGARWTDQVSDAGTTTTDTPVRTGPATPAPTIPAPTIPEPITPYVGPPGWEKPPPPRAWYTRWWIFVLAALALLAGITIPIVRSGGGGTGGGSAAATYTGRIRAVSGSDPATLREYTAAHDPVDIGTAPLAGEVIAASADGTWVVADDGTIAMMGSDQVQTLPEIETGLYVLTSATFLPDGTKVAYTGVEGGKVVVYDTVSKTSQVVLQTPCDFYTVLYSSTTVCGSADAALWLDAGTLLVWSYTGVMPNQVQCYSSSPSGIGVSCDEPDANTYSVVTTAGQTVATLTGATGAEPVALHGSTLVLSDGTWLDVAAMMASAPQTPQALPVGALVRSLSPDGTRIAVPGSPWKLVDIRTGAVQTLGATTTPQSLDADAVWSPDGQYLAVADGGDLLIIPISNASSQRIDSVDGMLAGWIS